MKLKSQQSLDTRRKTYMLTFPTDLDQTRVLSWLRSISGSLHGDGSRLTGSPTIVFETWASDHGIVHRLIVPKNEADYISGQLRSLVPGTTVSEDDTRPVLEWTQVVEVAMSSPSRQLRVVNPTDLSASLLASVQALGPEETVMTQWVLTPAPNQALPSKEKNAKSNEFSLWQFISGSQAASSDEIDDRRKKLEDQNLHGLGRIAAVAKTPQRADVLVRQVGKAMASANSNGNRLEPIRGNTRKLAVRVNDAATPIIFPAQFSILELTALVSWPIGQPFVAGLPQGSTRHLHATEDIARVGRILGHSNYPGHERPIAQSYHMADGRYAIPHTYIGGATGTGKSTLMANSFAQDVAQGYGGIIIDASNSDSSESLFSRGLSYVPRDRLDDVIIMDVSRNQLNPVGFNILDQGNPRIVVDQLTDLFGHLYQDTKGVWTKELLFHGLYTLAERPGMTFIDLITLLTPRNQDEVAWAEDVVKNVKDPELKMFWQRWKGFSQSERDRYTQPLMNRAWQLISRPETRNIIGQSHSSFTMTEVLSGNKILLVSLAGLPVETASLLGTLLVNALWTAAQTLTPDKPNFLYLDEFQLMTRLPMGLDDMLARARKHRLGVTLGTQYLEDVPMELKTAVINNATSRIIFQSSSRESRMWQQEFGRQYVNENDFMRIRKYEAIAQLATDSGTAAPVTLKSLAPIATTNVASSAVALSASKYGRPIKAVEEQMINRRKAEPTSKAQRPNIGIQKWEK